MNTLSMIFLIVTIVLLIITLGCGFAIHYGKEAFKNAILGHMILGVLTLLSLITLLVSVLVTKG